MTSKISVLIQKLTVLSVTSKTFTFCRRSFVDISRLVSCSSRNVHCTQLPLLVCCLLVPDTCTHNICLLVVTNLLLCLLLSIVPVICLLYHYRSVVPVICCCTCYLSAVPPLCTCYFNDMTYLAIHGFEEFLDLLSLNVRSVLHNFNNGLLVSAWIKYIMTTNPISDWNYKAWAPSHFFFFFKKKIK